MSTTCQHVVIQDDFKERRLNTASICQTKIVLCASDRAGRAIYVGKLNAGHEVDFKRFKEAWSGFKYQGCAVLVDLGFLGIRHHLLDAKIFILHKKPKGEA